MKKSDVAIIGMSCRFPGNVNNPDELWDLLKIGGDGIEEIPSDRWNINELYSKEPEKGKMYVKRGGFLKNIDKFEP